MTVLTKKPGADEKHISNDPRYKRWCTALKKRGVHPAIMWSTSSFLTPARETGHHDVYFVIFNGDGFSPAELTAFIHWYGLDDGFGVYYQKNGVSMDAEAAMIAGAGE